MTKPTHLTGSLLCGCVLGITTPAAIPGLFLGSLLCDVDTGTSALGHFFFWQSGKNHRGFFHSFLFLGIFILGSLKWNWCIPVSIGIASHILLDSLNTMPIQYLYPCKKRFRLPWSQIKAGSIYETLILTLMLMTVFLVFIDPLDFLRLMVQSMFAVFRWLIPIILSLWTALWNWAYPIITESINGIVASLG